MVLGSSEPLSGRRNGRPREKNERREPERPPAGRQPARRARSAGRDVQRSPRPTRDVHDDAASVHGRRFAHELRTPVATTRTAANVALQQTHREEREYRDTLAIIEQQAAPLSRIVDDMFTLARADAGTYPVRQMPMYLDEVVDDVVKAARVLASTQEVSIEAVTIRSAPLTGDEDLIRRLIVNLLDNAIRYTSPGSTVRIDLEQAPRGYTLSISDSGPGIPADVQPHIFERFYRADTAGTRRGAADG